MRDLTWQAVLPVNTSGRTKGQIVAEAEATWLLPHLLNPLECDADCRCMRCFYNRLDAAVKAGEEALGATIHYGAAADAVPAVDWPATKD